MATTTLLTASVEQCVTSVQQCVAKVEAMSSLMAAMKAANDKVKLEMSNEHQTLVTRIDNMSGSMVVSAEVSTDIATMVRQMKGVMTTMANDVKGNRFERRAHMIAGMAKLHRYVKCDDLTQGFQAFMACVGVGRGISTMALEAISLERGHEKDRDRGGDRAYQICLQTLFTFNVLGHFTQGGPK
jgi:hypothetical protein